MKRNLFDVFKRGTNHKKNSAYDEYLERFSPYFLKASTNGITGEISLSDSSISIPNLSSLEYVEYLEAQMEKVENIVRASEGGAFDMYNIATQYPETNEFFEHMELWSHEAFHGIQKHAYRSVFTLVDAVQNIEHWEFFLCFKHAVSGGKWKLGEGFISDSVNFDPRLQERIRVDRTRLQYVA